MAIYRAGYGVGNYNVRAFGLDGAITDAISLVETAAVTLAGGEVVKTSSASSVASSSLTSSGEFVVDAIASTASTSSTSSSGEVVYLGYAISSGTAAGTASLQFLTNAEAYGTAAASSTADCVRVRVTTQIVGANASVSCDGFITAWGGATIDVNLDASSACARVRKSPATIAGAADFTASGRYKYEQIAKDNESWAVVPQGNEIWTEVA